MTFWIKAIREIGINGVINYLVFTVQKTVRSRVSSKQSNFFSVQTETNRNSICFGCFSVCFAKPKNIFSVCFSVSDRYRNKRNKRNFVETKQSIPKQTKQSLKNVFYKGFSKQLIFFSRFEPKQTETQSFLVVFWFVFLRNQKICFRFVSVFRTGIETTETNRTYGMGN
jgi:hypothetical protein